MCIRDRLKLGLTVGWNEITKLASYFFTVVLVLSMQALIVYPMLLTFIAKVNPIIFLRKIIEIVRNLEKVKDIRILGKLLSK